MNVQKISCSEGLKPIECINPRRDRWAVRWDLHQEGENGWFAFEVIIDHKPTPGEIRSIIEAHIDTMTGAEIIDGFKWKGKKIRLTDSTQRNFLFAVVSLNHTGEIDRAPFIGLLEADTDEAAKEELPEIVAAMWQHIKERRAEGQQLKDAVDYSLYEL